MKRQVRAANARVEGYQRQAEAAQRVLEECKLQHRTKDTMNTVPVLNFHLHSLREDVEAFLQREGVALRPNTNIHETGLEFSHRLRDSMKAAGCLLVVDWSKDMGRCEVTLHKPKTP